MQTGLIIRQLRQKSGLTQEELADELFVTRFLVSKWETGDRRPAYEYVIKMAELFSVEPGEIADLSLIGELTELLSAENEPGETELKEKVNSFLSSLPERERNLFIMRYYYMKEIKELCDAFGMRKNAVYTSLSRTKAKLRDYFKE